MKSSYLTQEQLLSAIKKQEDFIADMESKEFRIKEGISDDEHIEFKSSALSMIVKLLKERIKRLEAEVESGGDGDENVPCKMLSRFQKLLRMLKIPEWFKVPNEDGTYTFEWVLDPNGVTDDNDNIASINIYRDFIKETCLSAEDYRDNFDIYENFCTGKRYIEASREQADIMIKYRDRFFDIQKEG